MNYETQNAFKAPTIPVNGSRVEVKKSKLPKVVELFIIVGILGILAAMLLPLSRRAPYAANRTRCGNHLRQPAIAILNYESDKQELPAAYLADDSGRAIHSWRQLVSPYLVGNESPVEYSMDEPWNSDTNRATEAKFIATFGNSFLCPNRTEEIDQTKIAYTSFRLVTGPGTIFVEDNAPKLHEVAGDPATKIMLIETPDLIPARSPKDISVAEAIDIQAPPTSDHSNSNHADGIWDATFDGATHFIYSDDDEYTRKKLMQMLNSVIPYDFDDQK